MGTTRADGFTEGFADFKRDSQRLSEIRAENARRKVYIDHANAELRDIKKDLGIETKRTARGTGSVFAKVGRWVTKR